MGLLAPDGDTVPARPQPEGAGVTLPATAAILLAAAGLLFSRRPDAFLHPQLWAEDGGIFYNQQHALGIAAVFTPYAGYYHLVPRLFALLLSSVDPLYIPFAYNAAALLCLLVTVGVLATSRLEAPYRVLWALAPVLVPHSGEVWMTLTNVNWTLGALLPALLLQPAPTRWRTALYESALVLLIGLSGPYLVLLSPLLLYRAMRDRSNPCSRVFCAFAGTAVLIQAHCLLLRTGTAGALEPLRRDGEEWFDLFGLRLPGGLFFGALVDTPEQTALWLGVVVCLIAVSWAITRMERTGDRRLCLLLLGAAGLLFAGGVVKHLGCPTSLHPLWAGARYFFVPYILGFWCLLLLTRNPDRRASWIGYAGAGLVLFAGATTWRVPSLPDLKWRDEVLAARRKGGGLVRINPYQGKWFVPVGADGPVKPRVRQ